MTDKNKNEDNNEETVNEEAAGDETTAVAKTSENAFQKGVGSFIGKNTNKPTQYYAKFLSRATLLEESGPPASSASTIRIIVTIVLVLITASCFATLNETSVAQGEVVPSSSVQPVQHLEGGIVKEVYVKDGDDIKKGEPLMQLDTTSTLSELNRVRARYVSLDMQMRRIRDFALREKADFSDYEDEYPVISLDQEKLLNQQKQSRLAQERVYISKIANSRNQLSVLEQQEAAQKEGMTIVPITLYFNKKGLAKLTIGLAKGKKKQDKRATIKDKEWGIKKQRLMKNY